MTTFKFSSVVVAMIVCLFVAPLEAGTINLNDVYNNGAPFLGTNYMWTDVVETNGPPDEPAFNFYRDPMTIGDTFIVNPTNFRVDVTPGPGISQIDSQLEMVIMGNNGTTIPFISFRESGDYEINARNPGEALVRATVAYFFQILEGPAAGQTGSGIETFEDSASPNVSGLWEISFSIPMPAGTTKVRFEYDNRLTAEASVNLSTAYIAKKLIDGVIIVVPEPLKVTAVGWLICTFLGFVMIRRSP